VVLWIVLLLPLLDTSLILETRTFLSSLFHASLCGLLAIPQHHVGNLDRRFLLHYTAFGILCRRLCVLGDDVGPFHITFPLPPVLLLPGAAFQVFVITGNYHHGVAF
jgi:hypothetical protein